MPQFYASIILNIKIKKDIKCFIYGMATTYDSNVCSSISVNLLNNLQGGKHEKANEKRKRNLN